MRIASVLISVSLTVVVACGHGHDGYATLQDCFDEHTIVEALPIRESIVVCCLDHSIDGVSPSCGDTEADCVDHVDAELDSSISLSEIEAACTDYIDEL
jgi:hypothetical protein